MKKYIFLLLTYIAATSCKTPQLTDCENIYIKNRWNHVNYGIPSLTVKDKSNIDYICYKVKNFPKGKTISANYHYGYLELNINDREIDIIFTVKNGIVFRTGIGEFIYDDALARRIMKIMKIKTAEWDVM